MFYTRLDGYALDAYKQMVIKLKETAMRELNLPEPEIVVRTLRASDVGMVNPMWISTMVTVSSYNNMVNTFTIADNRFIGINGVRYPKSTAQAVTELKITRAESVSRYWNIQGTNFLENEQVFFDDPFTVGQQQKITIQGWVPSKASTYKKEEIMLMGAVAEKRGILVNP